MWMGHPGVRGGAPDNPLWVVSTGLTAESE